MQVGTAIAIYFIIWWVVLFAVLPWGAHSQADSGEVTPGTEPGAPAVHRVGRKLMWTTVTAALVYAVLALLYKEGLIPFEFLKSISNPPHY
jgi:predicted secreted protein